MSLAAAFDALDRDAAGTTTAPAETDTARAERIAEAIADAIDDSGQRTVRTSTHYDPDAGTFAVRIRMGTSVTNSHIFDLVISAPGAIPALFSGSRFVGLNGSGITSDTAPANIAIALLARIAGYLATGR